MNKIHFWDFPSEIRIKLRPEYRRRFFSEVVNHFGSSRKVGLFIRKKSREYCQKEIYDGSIIRILKNTKKSKYDYCSSWLIIELSKKIGYDLSFIEKQIVGYRAPSGIKIVNVKFPIEITPEFTSILAHLMGDGTDKRTRDGISSYVQYDNIGLENFNKKIINTFGVPEKEMMSEKYHTVYIPISVVKIMKKYFAIKSFGTYESYIPKKIYSMPKEHRLAFLIAFLVDEGTIYDIVSLRLANRNMIKQLRKIIISLGYRCSSLKTSNNKVGIIYGINISNYSINEFLKDIKKLSEKYPTCNLAQKQKYFDYLVSIGRLSKPKRKPDETKSLIISSLEDGPKKVIELCRLTGVCRRTVRGHLEDLERVKKVETTGKTPIGAKIWSVK